MDESYLEFEIPDRDRFKRLKAVTAALCEAKQTGDFRDHQYWLTFFDDEAQRHFWWPTADEIEEFDQLWFSTPYEQRYSDPRLERPWTFGSMIDAFKNGDYELIGIEERSHRTARFRFRPNGWPFGGTESIRTLIESFGGKVTHEDGT